MQVNVSHRSNLVMYPKHVYEDVAARCVHEVSNVAEVTSVVICGSLAKDDIVPGWSDIDIIVIVDADPRQVDVLYRIAKAIQTAVGGVQIGIGLDLVYQEQFITTHKFCGRPYMMTYEVAAYGNVAYGANLMQSIAYDTTAQTRVNHERGLLIAAEVHSWRRLYAVSVQNQDQVPFLFASAKALLRLLQCETGPNLIPPINTQRTLQRLQQDKCDHPSLEAFSIAVDIRRNWPTYLSGETRVPTIIAQLVGALNAYPLSLPGVK